MYSYPQKAVRFEMFFARTLENGKYAGIITVQDIMASFAQSASVQMPGGILVLSMDLIDYSLAEISRYVEENNAKVISSTMVDDPLDHGKIKLTLKILTWNR